MQGSQGIRSSGRNAESGGDGRIGGGGSGGGSGKGRETGGFERLPEQQWHRLHDQGQRSRRDGQLFPWRLWDLCVWRNERVGKERIRWAGRGNIPGRAESGGGRAVSGSRGYSIDIEET